MMLGFQLFTGLNPVARTATSPGDPACRTGGPLCTVWTSLAGSGPLGAIYNLTPSRRGSTRSPALLCQVLKESFLKMVQPYVPHPGALNELFIEEGVEFSPLTAQSTQSRGQPPADRSAILQDFSVAVCGVQSLVHWMSILTLFTNKLKVQLTSETHSFTL